MGVTFAAQRDLRCPACNAEVRLLAWLAVDLGERPDLRATLADPAAYASTCVGCGASVVRDAPLLVVRMANAAPVILACPDDVLLEDDPFAGSVDLLERVGRALHDDGLSVPGPVLLAPFDVLMTALVRDVDYDAVNSDGALSEIAAEHQRAAQRYQLFLNDVRGSAAERRLNAALDRLVEVSREEELREVLAEHPVLLEPEVRERRAAVAAGAKDAEDRIFAAAQVAMLEQCAAGDVEGGWAGYNAALLGIAQDFIDPQIQELQRAFDEVSNRDMLVAASIGEQLLATARQLGDVELEAIASMRTSSAYYETTRGDRVANIERAVELLERTLEIYEAEPDIGSRDDRVNTLLNLGAAVAARHHGDPVANQERAIALQRRVLTMVSIDDHADAWAMAHTNLGLSLLEHERQASGDEVENAPSRDVIEAIGHFEQALRWRSFDRNPLDWAYTEVNLALAYTRLHGQDRRGELKRAIEHYTNGVRGFEAAGRVWLQAQAVSNRASARTDMALLEGIDACERERILADAVADARAAVTLQGEDSTGPEAGRRWLQLGRVLAAAERYNAELIGAHRRTLAELPAQTAPRDHRDAARRLAELAAQNGDWEIAAEAWEAAAQGAAAAVETRATRAGRFAEAHENLNVFRWAAYALTRVMKLERAVEVLELGRARELATWLERDVVDLDALSHLDPVLCERFVALRQAIEAADRSGVSAGDERTAAAAEALKATVAQIRQLPRMDRFLSQRRFADFAAATDPEEAVAYPVTSPYGSIWIVIRPDGTVTAVDVPGLTSTAIIAALLRPDVEEGTVGGYLALQTGVDIDLDVEIATASALLGPGLLAPLARELRANRIGTVCLVPVGLLGLVPLHALTWDENGAPRCLLDEFDVAYAPSAHVRGVCRGRAQERQPFTRLVAVGNPLPHPAPLPGAEFEAAVVASVVPAAESSFLVGEEATKEAALRSMPGASLIHLACHGQAAMTPHGLDAALSFDHGRPVSAAEILDIDLSAARLVVASACETGVIPGYETADEALALSTVFIGAGAAAAIATLWPVDDYATSLLMARFYEALVESPEAPAHALRVAQLWLRDLTPEEEARIVARHAELRDQRRLRARDDERAPGGRFGAPTAWAAFVFSGA